MPANQLFTDWVAGDLITASKLNQMKNDLAALSGATYSGATNFNANVFFNAGVQLTAANTIMEFGSVSVANTPGIDLHSSGFNIDYDVRLLASGGSGTIGQGTLSIFALTLALGSMSISGNVNFTGLPTVGTNRIVDRGSFFDATHATNAAIANGAYYNATFTVAGVTANDFVFASIAIAGVVVSAYASAANTVSLTIYNNSGASIPISTNVTVKALKRLW
jgi:hypothetical protein